MKFTSALKLINFFILSITLLIGLIRVESLAQTPIQPNQPDVPTLNPPQEILVPPQSDLDSNSSSSNQTQSSTQSSSIPINPPTQTGTSKQINNPSQPVAVSLEDVNPGDTSVRSGGAGMLATIFTLGIIGLGGYMYHKHIRDKSEFKIAEKKIK